MTNHASMNKVYRIVWNATLGVWQAVGEIGKGAGKGTSDSRKKRHASALAGAVFLLSTQVYAASLPQNGAVTLGSGSISQPNASTLNITQNTQKMAIDWQSFSIGQGNTVNFVQPSASAIALNRVVGNDVSSIQGAINANGQVFLINPNGVLFSTTAQVNVGALVASTRNLSNENFAAGNYRFEGTNSNAIINQGNITTVDGGYVVMISAKIDNTGSINAKGGLVGLASGDSVTLHMGGPVKLNVNAGTLNSLIANGGAIKVDGGHILLSAKSAGDLAASVINNTGIIEAKTLTTNAAGKIELHGDLVSHTGTLDASAANGVGGSISVNAGLLIDAGISNASGTQGGGRISQTANDIQQASVAQLNANGGTGKGGSIVIKGGASAGGQAYLSGAMSATGAQGGNIHATANNITLAGAKLDTSGTNQAGELLVGGGWQGKDNRIANAQTTNVSNSSSLNNQGDNGTVVVWSDDQTTFNGSIGAAGSAVEVSGKENLSAYIGNIQAQSLLLDPKNIEIKAAVAGLNLTTIANPNNTAGDAFGSNVTELSNGNLVITAASSDLITTVDQTPTTIANVGRVYLYKTDGTLISTLSGSTLNDSVGGTGVTTLSNGNYVVRSSLWDKDSTATNAGAVTWGSGTSGVNGVVSADKSLIGSTKDDSVGGTGITALSNGNYVVRSSNWDNEAFANAGAVTWGNGSTGVKGTIDATNSLVGRSRFADNVGSGDIIELINGDYVVASWGWDLKDDAGIAIVGDAGAVTWGSGTSGVTGTIDATNSLIGSATNDRVGEQLYALNNGNYVTASSGWGNDSAANDLGAVTWVNAANPSSRVGVVSASNSLIGSTTGDSVGASIITLSNGNFVVRSTQWDNVGAGAVNAGAVTWVNGTTGLTGAVSSSNSLVGSRSGDSVGGTGITTLSNGNFVVRSQSWNSESASTVGAVTWVDGTTGLTGAIDSTNSLVGDKTSDNVGNSSVTELTNGNYVVASNNWGNDGVIQAGAVTWVNASNSASRVGVVSASNSLVGSKAQDFVGDNVTALTNGNYVVASRLWNNEANTVDVGAVTWVDGSGNTTTGVGSRVGVVSASNSLVGSTANDNVGSAVTALTNGNYVTTTKDWDNVGATNAGAVTWGNGTSGTVGTVSASNSLVGRVANDNAGNGGVTALSNGHYVVASANWDNGNSATNAGAVTWSKGDGSTVGEIDDTNSLVGSTANDGVGSITTRQLSNGNYIVVSRTWDNGSLSNAGAVTWANGNTGVTGTIDATNSILGNRVNAQLGGSSGVNVRILSNGYFSVADTGDTQGGKVYVSNGSGGASGTGDAVTSATFASNPSGNSIITPDSITALLNAGTFVRLQANNDITVTDAITANNVDGRGGVFMLQAGRNININNAITTDDNHFIAVAGATGADANNKDAGSPTITLGAAGAINTGTRNIQLVANGAGSSFVNNSTVDTPLQAAIASIFLPTYNVAASGNTPAQTYFTKGNLITTGKLYNTSYNQALNSGSCGFAGCVMPTSGINVFYAATPTLTVTPTTGQTSTYGNSFTATGSTLSGYVDGDDATTAQVKGEASFSVGGAVSSSGNITAGAHDVAYSSGLASGLGYVFADATSQMGELTVAQKTLAITGLTASNKTYDATRDATLTGTATVAAITGDVVSVAGTAVGSFADKNVGTAKAVSVTGLTLSGADAGNYSLIQQTGLSANISKKDISITGLTASNKVYDGTTAASLTGTAIVTAIEGDTVSVAGTAVGSFANKNVGTAKAVSVTGLTLSGADAANYTVGALNSTADITRLSSVTWVGPTTGGDWFNPANWAGGAVPDLSNVANVILPTGVSVSFNTTNVTAPADATQAVNIDSLMGVSSAAGGSLSQANGSLVVGTGGINLTGLTQNGGSISSAGNVTAADLAQTNGTLSTTGNLTLSNSFSQSATGVITVGGNTSITDLIDGIALGNLNTTGTTQVTSRGGNITQNAGTSIASVGTSTWVAQSSSNPATDYDITLTNEGNDFTGAVTASGNNINITDKNALTAAITSTGNSSLSAAGNLAVSGSSTGNLTTSTTGTGTTSYGVTNVGGNLASSSAGDVTQTGALSVTGTTALNATGKDITLDNIANQFIGAMSFVAKDVLIGASQPVTVAVRDVNSLRFVGNATPTVAPTAAPTVAPTVAPTAAPANAARGTAAQIPVQPVVTPMTLTPVFVPTTPTVGLGTANVGTNGVSGGLVFVDAPSAAPANNATPNNTAKPATSTGGSGIDASGFMRVSVVNGGINSGSGNNE